jgi:hypothetical protein
MIKLKVETPAVPLEKKHPQRKMMMRANPVSPLFQMAL